MAAAAAPASSGATKVASEPKGRSVSGRIWKTNENKRASTLFRKTNANLSTTWEAKMALREKTKAMKEREKEMMDERKAEFEKKKEKREERMKRRMENEFKSAAYQTITKTDKIKAMSKKQLRQIKKTQVNKLGQVELVSPWAVVDKRGKTKEGKAIQKWTRRTGAKKR